MEHYEPWPAMTRALLLTVSFSVAHLAAQDRVELLQKAARGDGGAVMQLCKQGSDAMPQLLTQMKKWFPGDETAFRDCRRSLATHGQICALIDLAVDAYWTLGASQASATQDIAKVRTGEARRVLLALLDVKSFPPFSGDVVYESPAVNALTALPIAIPDAGIKAPREYSLSDDQLYEAVWRAYFAGHPDQLNGNASWGSAMSSLVSRNDAKIIMAAGLAMGPADVQLLRNNLPVVDPQGGAWFGIQAVLARSGDSHAIEALLRGAGSAPTVTRPRYADAIAYVGPSQTPALCGMLGRFRSEAATVLALESALARGVRDSPSSGEWNVWCDSQVAKAKQ